VGKGQLRRLIYGLFCCTDLPIQAIQPAVGTYRTTVRETFSLTIREISFLLAILSLRDEDATQGREAEGRKYDTMPADQSTW
jgi:hypothetical protein